MNETPRYQVLDGDETVLAIWSWAQLRDLVAAGRVAPWARVLDTTDLATTTAGAVTGLEGPDPTTVEKAPARHPANPATAVTMPAALAAGAGHSAAPPPADPAPPPVPAQSATNDDWDGYQLLRPLGRGGMGEVHLAQRLTDGVEVALKILPDELSRDPTFIRRFQREAQVTDNIDSPYVIKALGTGCHCGRYYFVMEYADGTNLADKIKQGYRFTVSEAVRIGCQCGEALWAAGKNGIVHRDIKPGNVMWLRDGNIRIMDFGLATAARDTSALTKLTAPGTVLGSARYMSPEQASSEHCDHRSDIYSLGVMLYELLAGTPPFSGKDVAGLLHQHVHTAPPSLRLTNPDVPEAVAQAVMRCLIKDPNARYQSSRDLVQDLRAAERGQSTSRPMASASERRLTRPPRRHAAALAIFVLVVAGLLGGGAWFVWTVYENRARRPQLRERGPAVYRSDDRSAQRSSPTETKGDTTAASSTTAAPTAPPSATPATALAAYQQARLDDDLAACWRAAHRFATRWPERVHQSLVRLPLRIDSDPPGAMVRLDGTELGPTPRTHWAWPDAEGELVLTAPGHTLAATSLATRLAEQWSWRVDLAPLPGLAWLRQLPGQIIAPLAWDGRKVCAITDQDLMLFIDPADGRLRPLQLDMAGVPLRGGPVLHDGLYHLLYRDRVLTVDPRVALVRWRWPRDLASDAELVHGPTVIEHELMPGRRKLHLGTRYGEMITLIADGGGARAPPRLATGTGITAAPAALAIDIASSVVAVPCQNALRLYDGASQDDTTAATPRYDVPLQRPLPFAPLATSWRGRPHLMAIDRRGTVLAIDIGERPPPPLRVVTSWDLDLRPADGVHRLDDHLVVVATDGTLAGIDLAANAIAWRRPCTPPATPAGPPLIVPATGAVIVTLEDGRILSVDARTGTRRRTLACGAPLASGAILAGERLIVVSGSGLALGIDWR